MLHACMHPYVYEYNARGDPVYPWSRKAAQQGQKMALLIFNSWRLSLGITHQSHQNADFSLDFSISCCLLSKTPTSMPYMDDFCNPLVKPVIKGTVLSSCEWKCCHHLLTFMFRPLYYFLSSVKQTNILPSSPKPLCWSSQVYFSFSRQK